LVTFLARTIKLFMKVVVTPEAQKAEAGQTSHTEAAEDHWIGMEAHGLSPSKTKEKGGKAKHLTEIVECIKTTSYYPHKPLP
jgi:hypothetical protein